MYAHNGHHHRIRERRTPKSSLTFRIKPNSVQRAGSEPKEAKRITTLEQFWITAGRPGGKQEKRQQLRRSTTCSFQIPNYKENRRNHATKSLVIPWRTTMQNPKTNRTKKTQERKDTPKLLVNDDDDDDATMPVSATVADTNYNLNPKLLY